ncbi:MAG: UvrD-helicase domain-containing protein [Coriobacteriia bacterium]
MPACVHGPKHPQPLEKLSESILRGHPAQRAAASHGSGPLLVVAGADTGKTAALAHRVAHLMASGVPASRILLLTFSRRAADEMLRRVEGLLRGADVGSGAAGFGARVWDGTFHSMASRLLRTHGESIGLPPGFTILDRSDSEDLMHVFSRNSPSTRPSGRGTSPVLLCSTRTTYPHHHALGQRARVQRGVRHPRR